MKADLYKKVQDVTGVQADARLFRSAKIYLEEYKDTSKTKEDRMKALMAAATLIEWVVNNVLIHTNEKDVGSVLFSAGIRHVMFQIELAKTDRNTLYDFKESIGFLSVVGK